jgi:hypothetical protein
MKAFAMVRRIFLIGALLGSLVPARPAESSTAAGTGVVSVAPRNSELGAGWGEREVIFAIDPLEQPAEYVNTIPVKNPTQRARSILEDVRKALARNGSVGMTDILYRRSSGHLELVISRYPDQQSLDKHWKELSAKFDTNAVAPKVGQSAAWLDIGAGAPGRMFVFRQGLFTGWAECKVALSGEPLMELVKVTAGKMAKAAEPQHSAAGSQPVRSVPIRESPAAGSHR